MRWILWQLRLVRGGRNDLQVDRQMAAILHFDRRPPAFELFQEIGIKILIAVENFTRVERVVSGTEAA